MKFVAYFPDLTLETKELKQLLIPKIGGRFDFDTFPAFKSKSDLLLAEASRAALTVSPGDAVQSGKILFLIPKAFPSTRNVTFLVVNESGQPVARVDVPLPPAIR